MLIGWLLCKGVDMLPWNARVPAEVDLHRHISTFEPSSAGLRQVRR